jgi:hypothetical protein
MPQFSVSAQDGDKWFSSCVDRFTPKETARNTIWIGGGVGLRDSLDAVG